MRWSFVLPVLGLLLAPAVVHADDAADAKAAYARGRAFFKAGQFPEAAAELNKAYALKPHPALLRYLGDTYFKMNDARQAISHYKRYLQEAPEAPDKDKVEAKVKELEGIVASGKDGAAAQPAGAASRPLVPGKLKDAPTGEDREVPLALRRKVLTEQAVERPNRRGKWLAAGAFTTAGLAVAGLALGITFNRMAASSASDLENAARTDCPGSSPQCSGNPNMDNPVVPFSRRHYDLQEQEKTYRTVSIASFIASGVMAGASAVFFYYWIDKMRSERGERQAVQPPRASVAPMLGGNTWGLSGAISF
jgi:tetratricopeptide (TPR) repeat protein